MNPWPILAAVILIGLAGFQGYRMGYAASEGVHATQALKARNEAASREVERLALQRERDRLAQDLEDQANADPDDGQCVLPAGRVQRLNLR